jgi:hypothetical protein
MSEGRKLIATEQAGTQTRRQFGAIPPRTHQAVEPAFRGLGVGRSRIGVAVQHRSPTPSSLIIARSPRGRNTESVTKDWRSALAFGKTLGQDSESAIRRLAQAGSVVRSSLPVPSRIRLFPGEKSPAFIKSGGALGKGVDVGTIVRPSTWRLVSQGWLSLKTLARKSCVCWWIRLAHPRRNSPEAIFSYLPARPPTPPSNWKSREGLPAPK